MLLPDGTLYLDANATTPLAPEALAALMEAAARCFGNPSSAHAPGREARALLEESRRAVSSLVGCDPSELVFTSSGTEANHLAWTSALGGGGGRRKVITSSVEHPSILAQLRAWEARGFVVQEAPVMRTGVLDLQRLDALLSEDVALVSVMAAHNETGVLQPLEQVGQRARRCGALFHTDAVQAMGKVQSPWKIARPDYLSLSGHKLYGPKGAGALAVRLGAPAKPMLLGGGQESGRRASTEPVPLLHCLGVAASLASEWLPAAPALAALRDDLESTLKERFGANIHGEGAPRLPNTSFFCLPGHDGASIAAALDLLGIFVATGSACHSGNSELPRVLLEMGLRSGPAPLRVSLCRATTGEDLGRFSTALKAAVRAGQ